MDNVCNQLKHPDPILIKDNGHPHGDTEELGSMVPNSFDVKMD